MGFGLVVAACTALVVLGGCGSGNSPGPPGAESSGGQHAGGGNGSSGPDSPVSGDVQASADLPGLPIGGNVSFEPGSSTTCAFLAWNGGNLPAGVVVRITELNYPAGVSLDASASCDGPPCLDADSFTPDHQTCTVGLAWDGNPPADPEPTMSASGKVTCASQDVCDQVKADAGAGGVVTVEVPDVSEPPESSGTTEPPDSSGTTESTDPTGESS